MQAVWDARASEGGVRGERTTAASWPRAGESGSGKEEERPRAEEHLDSSCPNSVTV